MSPPSSLPSEMSRTVVGVGSSSGARPAGRLADLDRLGDRVAERRALACAELTHRQRRRARGRASAGRRRGRRSRRRRRRRGMCRAPSARNSRIDFLAASMRVGGTSFAAMERDVSMAIMIVAFSRGTDSSACRPREGHEQRRERDRGGSPAARVAAGPGSRSTTLGSSAGEANWAATRDRRRWCTTYRATTAGTASRARR